jgi:hypothetical protein
MGTNVSQNLTETQSISNNALNAVTSICNTDCSQIESGNTVIIQGTTISGNITFNQSCIVEQKCQIQNNLSTQVSNILDASGKQTSITANGFPDFNFNGVEQSATSTQIITNRLTNLSNATCSTNSTQIQNSNYTYLSSDVVKGSLEFDQTADVNASCVLTNTSSLVASNQASANLAQSSTILGTTGLIIALIIVVVIIVVVIFIIGRFKKKSSGGGISSEDVANAIVATNANATSTAAVATPVP